MATLAMLLLGLTPVQADPSATGLDLANLDRSAKPCQDFYQFADGGWMARNPIPPDRPRWGTFNVLADRNRDILKDILEELAAHPGAPGSIEQQLGDYYASGMDATAVDKAGLDPLRPELDRIAGLTTRAEVQAEIAHLHGLGINPYFRFGSVQDARDSTQVIGEARQGGLGLPERDYYFRQDEASRNIREAYLAHLQKMFELMGDSPEAAKAQAKTVLDLETRLAQSSMTKVELRDPEKTYHRMSLSELADLTPSFDWPAYFERQRLPGLESINVATPGFFKTMDEALTTVPLEDQKTYLRWHVVHAVAADLSAPFVDEDFDFYGKTLTGAPQNLPRWKRIVASTDSSLGMALGQKFVERTFPPAARTRVESMVANLRAVLKEDLEHLPWMSQATREQAPAKLAAIRQKIGYPDKWRDYSKLAIDRGVFAENVLRAQQFEVRRDLAKIGKPLDRSEWYMTPQTVNAYYDPNMNEIVFPAGILQPPFFSENYNDALNYGAMGMVIGHELTHGFDDQGAKYDAQGNLKNWWTPEDKDRFDHLALGVVQQFDNYTVADGLHINGKLVVGESIADLGGLKLAYKAFQRATQDRPCESQDGFTPEQQFFLAYARVWAMNMRPEYERLQVNTDPHPHPRYRVNGPLSNMPEFQQAFGCPAGSPMVRTESQRNVIW